MMDTVDLERIMGNKLETERKINAVMLTCKNATSDWAKDYWFNVWKKLCQKYGRTDLYNAHLH